MSEEPKKEEPKEECKKEECKKDCKKGFPFKGFHGFGPRCHGHGMGFPPMFGPPGPHKHKERKCECCEVIPKRKEGEP